MYFEQGFQVKPRPEKALKYYLVGVMWFADPLCAEHLLKMNSLKLPSHSTIT